MDSIKASFSKEDLGTLSGLVAVGIGQLAKTALTDPNITDGEQANIQKAINNGSAILDYIMELATEEDDDGEA